jgi:hypothetical protein
MRSIYLLIIIPGLLFLFGCSSYNIGRQYKFIEPNASANSNIGYLKIYTFKSEEKLDFADDPVNEVFKGYTIYSKSGDYVEDVKKSYGKPAVVKLKEGEYIVVAELHKNIINSFFIKVEKGKVLEIDKNMIQNPVAFN